MTDNRHGVDNLFVVLKELYYDPTRLITLRVVAWGDKPPTIEKRKLYVKDGQIKQGREIGLNLYDLRLLTAEAQNIEEIMNQHVKTKEAKMRNGQWPIHAVGRIKRD